MIIDSHCHLDYPNLYDQLLNVLNRAKKNKVNNLLTICTTLESFKKLMKRLENGKGVLNKKDLQTIRKFMKNVQIDGKSVYLFPIMISLNKYPLSMVSQHQTVVSM